MTQVFTQNDLIRYLYHETTEKETQEINQALICDPDLQREYSELQDTKALLSIDLMEPSESCVENILIYTRDLQEKR